ncbi:MAG: SAVED domain-containing protein [Chloroflexi bacterium]|nr:SAVED domain-containing protein [Chloroflexota bacterium]
MTAAQPTENPIPHHNFLDSWLENTRHVVGEHAVLVFSERLGGRACVDDDLRGVFRDHYMSREIWEQRIEALGAPETASILREMLPKSRRMRSGDTGEILAVEVAERFLDYTVPIRKLRWKDGRELALRGEDLLGIAADQDGNLRLLKGESKSRATLNTSTLNEAAQALEKDEGRPSNFGTIYVATRLRESGDDGLATKLELAVRDSFAGLRIEHFAFAVCGNDPATLMLEHSANIRSDSRRRYVAGVRIMNHRQFIEALYESL